VLSRFFFYSFWNAKIPRSSVESFISRTKAAAAVVIVVTSSAVATAAAAAAAAEAYD